MADIKVGDQVMLKSGGPTMVVARIGEGTHPGQTLAWCDWFDEKKQAQNKPFPITSLEVYTGPHFA